MRFDQPIAGRQRIRLKCDLDEAGDAERVLAFEVNVGHLPWGLFVSFGSTARFVECLGMHAG